jgi:DNA-binding beta-propeller fold protein YncE
VTDAVPEAGDGAQPLSLLDDSAVLDGSAISDGSAIATLRADPPPPQRRRLSRKLRRLLALLLILLLLLVAAFAGWYLVTRKPISELPGTALTDVPSYKGSIYGIERPLGVAVTPDGSRIYATQNGDPHAVLVFDRNGKSLGSLALPEPDIGHTPVYLSVAPDGNVYVGDRATGQIYVFSAAGSYVKTFTPADPGLVLSPLGIAVGADGTVYVADVISSDPADHCILVFSATGDVKAVLGKGSLSFPNEIALDPDGNLFVADANDGRLLVFTPDGTQTTLVAHGVGDGDLGLPRGVGIDDRGRIFVVDTSDHMVRTYAKSDPIVDPPAFQGSFGDQGVDDGMFQYPNGLAVDTRGRVYIADTENNRIQVWGY